MQKLSESRPDGEKKDEEAQMRRQVKQSIAMIHHASSLGSKGKGVDLALNGSISTFFLTN